MNIKDFLAWRPDCFFCKEELFISMQFPNYKLEECEKPEYFIEDEALHFKSRYMDLTVDIVSGYIESSIKSVDLTNFLARNNLALTAKCLWCPAMGRAYAHVGIYDGSQNMTHMRMTDLRESVIQDNIYFKQSQAKQLAIVNKFSNREQHLVTGEEIYIPYLDLSKINPDNFSNKIKTYVTFS